MACWKLAQLKFVGWGFLLLVACNDNKELPLPEDRLVPVLRDLHVAESAVLQLHGAEKDSVLQLYYEQIYAVHGVEKAEVDTSLYLLKHDPQLMEEVYGKVLKSLEALNNGAE